ncbi:MAG: hypothetical protein HYZ48_05565 [Chlamydiales bacterium]|nr:hypothetical protein [Chlamydiales bacterium]
MCFSNLKKWTLLFSLIAVSSAFADHAQPVSKKTPSPMEPGYDASCRICIERPYDFFLSASFTYWRPSQENMALGAVSNTESLLDLVNGKVVELDFDYKPGFQIGAGMNFDHDSWDTFIQYTWFRGTEHVQRNLNPDNLEVVLLPAWQSPSFLNPAYHFGLEKWDLNIDLLDWDLARSYHVGNDLCFRSFLGLRAAWIHQKVHVRYSNANPSQASIWPATSVDQKNSSWGIGPRMGISSNWNFGKGWRLFGDAEFDILCTHYDLKSKQTSDVLTANRYLLRDDPNFLRMHTELNLGLGWGSYFSSDRYHIDIAAGYGFQVFFDQNMFLSTVSNTAFGKAISPNGNLYMQGLTTSFRFDF